MQVSCPPPLTEKLTGAGAKILVVEVALQPKASVAVKEYMPVVRLEAVKPVPPIGDHEYVKPPTPPETLAVDEAKEEGQLPFVLANETKIAGETTTAEVPVKTPQAFVAVNV